MQGWYTGGSAHLLPLWPGFEFRSCYYNIPANRPVLIGIVPIFELQNLKKLGHSDFLREKKAFFL